jgi:ABC-type branched-subunit amino acid transport system substrate-binding protein
MRCHGVIVFAAVALAMIAAFADAQSRPTRTFCMVPAGELTPSALHAAHALTYYASTFPSLEWRGRLLGDGNLTTRNFVASWAVNGIDNCDALIGPGFSFLAIAMSPLVEKVWADFSATSVELSDKTQHPYFSRLMPTDEVGARMASAAMLRLGWKRINIFCVDDAYGRSVAGGVSAEVIRNGGEVVVQRCLPGTSTKERVSAALDALLASDSRIVFGALLPTQQTAKLLVQVALERRVYNELVFFFSESMCSLNDRSYAKLTGALCATYTLNPAIMQPFYTSYFNNRDLPALRSSLYGMGLKDPLLENTTDIYALFAHDATFHVMSSLHEQYLTKSNLSTVAYLRQHVSIGGTGEIRMDVNGDRIIADAAVYNAQPGAVEVDIGRVINGQFSFLGGAANPQLYFLGKMSAEYPVDVIPKPTASASESNVPLIVAVSVSCVALVILAVGVGVAKLTAPQSRDNRAAPQDQTKPFAIAFTDIQSSTTLWAEAPMETSEAIALHHSLIRELIAQHRGYEVKTIGDAFMVAFKEPKVAIHFALDVQDALYNAQWGANGRIIDRVYREKHRGLAACRRRQVPARRLVRRVVVRTARSCRPPLRHGRYPFRPGDARLRLLRHRREHSGARGVCWQWWTGAHLRPVPRRAWWREDARRALRHYRPR